MLRFVILLISVLTVATPSAWSQDHSYDVSGTGDQGDFSGTVDSWNGNQTVEGTVTYDDGTEATFEGEWVGNGQIEGEDENGNYVEMETE